LGKMSALSTEEPKLPLRIIFSAAVMEMEELELVPG